MTDVPSPAELAAWCAVGSVPSATGRFVLERAAGGFGWATVGPPPALVDVPSGAEVAFWHERPGRWRLEVAGALLAVADGERAAAWSTVGVRVGPHLLCPDGPPALLEAPAPREADGEVVRDDLLGRTAWRWTDADGARWVDEETGVLLRQEGAGGVLALTALEVGVDVPQAAFLVPDVPPEQVDRWLDLPRAEPRSAPPARATAGFGVPWWPAGCGGWPIAGDPSVPVVLMALATSDDEPWHLGVAPAGHEPPQHGVHARRWDGEGWRFVLSHPEGVPDEELDRVVASVPRRWEP